MGPGKYLLHQTFFLSAHSNSLIYKRPSAEFAPEPALDPLWISYWEPFHGVKKDSFGFQVILKVVADTAESTDDRKAAESTPTPSSQPRGTLPDSQPGGDSAKTAPVLTLPLRLD